MEQPETETEAKQLNIGLVSEEFWFELDSLFRKYNAAREDQNKKPITKKELYPPALILYLKTALSWMEAKEETRKQILKEQMIDELITLFEGAIG